MFSFLKNTRTECRLCTRLKLIEYYAICNLKERFFKNLLQLWIKKLKQIFFISKCTPVCYKSLSIVNLLLKSPWKSLTCAHSAEITVGKNIYAFLRTKLPPLFRHQHLAFILLQLSTAVAPFHHEDQARVLLALLRNADGQFIGPILRRVQRHLQLSFLCRRRLSNANDGGVLVGWEKSQLLPDQLTGLGGQVGQHPFAREDEGHVLALCFLLPPKKCANS